MSKNKQVVAERASRAVMFATISWIFAVVFSILGGWLIVSSGDALGIFFCFLFVLICLGAAIYYTVILINTPFVLAEFSDGFIIVYPSKKERIEISPDDIASISQRQYSNGRWGTSSSGTLEIKLKNSKLIELRHVCGVDDVRQKIENIRVQNRHLYK
ncbi:MAG: hypothetical protein FWC82_04125 [Firmicutes bacterium]|nr:hypothetical protein [Bacillota bacterium]